MSYAFFLLSVLGSAAISASLGGRRGFWLAWFLGIMACPVWLRFEIGSLLLDMRTGAFLGGLVGLAVRPERLSPGRFLLADLLVGTILVAQLVSDYLAGEFGTFSIFEGSRQWLLPYLAGRLFLGSVSDITGCLRAFCPVFVGVCSFAVFEAVTKYHVVAKLLGKSFGILDSGEGYRMGLKRAQGMMEHPIYFGLLLALLSPLALEAGRQARARLGPAWWRIVAWFLGAAVFATVSRGPQLAALGAFLIARFFRLGRLRIPVLCVAVALAGAALSFQDVIINTLEAAAGESAEEGGKILIINGEEELYSGTRHRVLLFKVYEEYLAKAGWFGYGNKMRAIVLEEELAERFWSIDSHYVRFYLQRGYSGIVPFVLLQVWTLAHMGWIAWRRRDGRAGLASGMFGAGVGVSLVLFSVWFAADFGTVWTFMTGLAANLVTISGDGGTGPDAGPVESAPAAKRTRRLVSGHAPVRARPGGEAMPCP